MNYAFLFPGQGSQSVGMLAAYGDIPSIRHVVSEASEILGQDIERLVAEGPANELNSTVNTQPVMVTVGYATNRAWLELGGVVPTIAAGHSLGEYSALVAAGALSLADCLPLVRLRAQAMQDAVPVGQGAMAAILGMDDDAIRAACVEASQGQIVEAVNFNAPGQVVIAGHAAAVARAIECAKAHGAQCTFDGFALGVEHTVFQGDFDFGFHNTFHILNLIVMPTFVEIRGLCIAFHQFRFRPFWLFVRLDNA